MLKDKIIRGNLIHTPTKERFEVHISSYMVMEDGVITGIYKELPEKYTGAEVEDFGDNLIIPPFCDIHLHAPQFNNVGLGMDMQLLDWLNTYTFPEEASFSDPDYANGVYRKLLNTLYEAGSLYFVAFGSIYKNTDLDLMQLTEKSGMQALIGKVNMDSNSPDFYKEDTETSIRDTIDFVERSLDFENVAPIITPRFVPSCSGELMKSLGEIAKKYDLFIQSHLNENRGEIAWVKELFPEYQSYLDVYDKLGLLHDKKTIMAHCIWMTDEDIELLGKKRILVAHCPYSNSDLGSGIAPVQKMIKSGVPIGLASDISGGHEIFMPRVLSMAAEFSKLYRCHVEADSEPLSDSECFYMATAQGEYLFPGSGSFKIGNRADYLVIDDSTLPNRKPDDPIIRLMRYLYTGTPSMIKKRVIKARELEKPF